MKSLISSILSLTLCLSTNAQSSIHSIGSSDKSGNWWTFNNNVSVTPSTFLETYKESMGFTQDYTFELLSDKDDNLGMNHQKYAQLYKGVKVEGAQYIIHSKNQKPVKANGRLVTGINGGVTAQLTFEDALNIAKKLTGAKGFYWENPQMEQWIKEVKHDPTATFLPKNELVWIDPQFSQNGESYRLAYKLDLYFEAIDDHATYYIDAQSGDLILEMNECHSATASAQAHTKYHGLQDIITDSISSSKYVLNDNTRGGGIETLNALTGRSISSSVDFEDTDNLWNNINPQIDEAATDAHWGAEMTYDYFLNQHGRNSYDDQGSKIMSYVHWDQNWFNASWNGIAMRYGDGNGNPLISIDVVGHELAHGVTEYSASLIYANESGALNESFSDIFGAAIEFYTMGNAADWAIGKLDFHLRQMDNPNSFNDPDTYFGNYWYTGTGDNGGVHINSGVQNYWFYLLSEGGSGVNDLGNSFQVDSFGIENAAEIAYRNLAYYLTPSSNYYDSRRGSISAAEDIYGSCSYETNLIAKAWHAVGVGSDTLSNDVQIIAATAPENGCDLGAQETMALQYTYFRSGCDSTIESGDSIKFGYSINGGSPIIETQLINSRINSHDTLTYTFSTKADFTNTGSYQVKYWVHYAGDFMQENDTLSNILKVLEATVKNDSFSFDFTQIPQEEPKYNLFANSNGKSALSALAKNTGVSGLVLTANTTSLSNLDMPNGEHENFTKNDQNLAKACFCVDASSMNHVTLQFDLRQTYSGYYQYIIGPGGNIYATSLRVTVDGNQVGPQFHPASTMQDNFKTQYFNLDQFAGTQFELCLEGKHFITATSDPGRTQGDNSYVDNLKFTDVEYISEEEITFNTIQVYPNPSSGIINVDVQSLKAGEANLKITDIKGSVVINNSTRIDHSSELTVDLSNQPKGIYFMQIQQGNAIFTQKVILE